MLTHRGFEASIVCEGGVLDTFAAQYDDDDRVASGWVASRPGKAFALRVHQCAERISFQATVYVDGHKVSWGVCKGGKRTTVPANLLKNPDADVGQHFIFYNIVPSTPSPEDEDDLEEEAGTIRVDVRRVKCTEGENGPLISPLNSTSHCQDPEEAEPCVTFFWRHRTLGKLISHRSSLY
ncbi:hypothetical protein EXIGLDRAFT_459323 [Exidia glandulosa HHB12029]|uniref:Uncharacterized protein n=1 Tax=Exidia glandulosa HHB12029 TaxID=1314781 RepID=A0A165PQF0_EXIGL|nr:hypothetical protein EXIGLDRAFT_459323 [Exidia glandulosa HHB12029]